MNQVNILDQIRKNENYQEIINQIFYGKDHERLNDKEIMLYCHLMIVRHYESNTLKTKFRTIADKINFVVNIADNRDYVEKYLRQLHEKGYIEIENIDDVDIRKDHLMINFPKANPDKRFTTVPNEFLSVVNNATEFSVLIFILVELFKTKGEPIEIATEKFEDKLLSSKNKGKSITGKTIHTALNAMEERGIITINRGYFFRKDDGQVNQKTNVYMINLDNIYKMAKQTDQAPANKVITFKAKAPAPVKAEVQTEDEKLKREAEELVNSFPFEILEQEVIAVYSSFNPYIVPMWEDKRKNALKKFRIPNDWIVKAKKIKEQNRPKPQEEVLEELEIFEDHFSTRPFLLIETTGSIEYQDLIDQLEDQEQKEKAQQRLDELMSIALEEETV